MCLGVPAQVVELLSDDFQFAAVDIGGVRRAVNVGMLADDGGVAVDDWVLVHVGFAVARLDPAEAADATAMLLGLGLDDGRAEYPAGEDAAAT